MGGGGGGGGWRGGAANKYNYKNDNQKRGTSSNFVYKIKKSVSGNV